MCRELDHAMLRRLEKRILVDLPNEPARFAMFQHYLPPVISQPPLSITTEIDYQALAEVSQLLLWCIFELYPRPTITGKLRLQ